MVVTVFGMRQPSTKAGNMVGVFFLPGSRPIAIVSRRVIRLEELGPAVQNVF